MTSDSEWDKICDHLLDIGLIEPFNEFTMGPQLTSPEGFEVSCGGFGVIKAKDAPVLMEDGTERPVLNLQSHTAERCSR